MLMAYHVMSSPVGLLFLARSERGLRYLEFMDRKSLKRMIANHADELPGATWRPSLLELKPVVDQLEAYFYGTRTEFTVPLDAQGSEFQLKVWGALRRIPYGATRTYGEIASAVGQPRAARAVGLANNQNPLAIIVPCHRVIGSDGSMVGYGGGLQRKQWLLDNEARYAQPPGRTGSLFAPPAHAPGVVAVVAKPPARPEPVLARASGTVKAPALKAAAAKSPAIKPTPPARAAARSPVKVVPPRKAAAAKSPRRAVARPAARPGTSPRKSAPARAAARGRSR